MIWWIRLMLWLGLYKTYEEPSLGERLTYMQYHEVPSHPNCRCYVQANPHMLIDALKRLNITAEEAAERINEFNKIAEKNNMTTYADIFCPKCQGSWMTEFLTTSLELLEWIKSKNYNAPVTCIHCKEKFSRVEVIEHIEQQIDDE